LISFPGGETIRNVAAGIGHSLAVTTTGQVYAWGSNLYGQLGDNTLANKSTPTLISFNGLNNLNDGETMRDVVAGGEYSHAVTTNGRVYSWGSNNRGQLGDGTSGTSQNQNIANKSTPTLISFTGLQNGETIRNIFLGNGHSLAVTTNNRLYAWGLNNSSQLGDGATANKQMPILVFLMD
jgi:alpha-tubulin suppressor-like RCC1 family protein